MRLARVLIGCFVLGLVTCQEASTAASGVSGAPQNASNAEVVATTGAAGNVPIVAPQNNSSADAGTAAVNVSNIGGPGAHEVQPLQQSGNEQYMVKFDIPPEDKRNPQKCEWYELSVNDEGNWCETACKPSCNIYAPYFPSCQGPFKEFKVDNCQTFQTRLLKGVFKPDGAYCQVSETVPNTALKASYLGVCKSGKCVPKTETDCAKAPEPIKVCSDTQTPIKLDDVKIMVPNLTGDFCYCNEQREEKRSANACVVECVTSGRVGSVEIRQKRTLTGAKCLPTYQPLPLPGKIPFGQPLPSHLG